MILDHLSRVKDGARDTYHLHNLSEWAQKNLYLDGKLLNMQGKYSFQTRMLDDTARVINTLKPAQIGATISTIAYFLSALATQPKLNTIYALPSASDASKLTTTKVNPLIYGSPALKRLLNPNVDSVELKQFGNNFLFTRGSKSETAALSISADLLVVDELDRCDEAVTTQFRSRLQASDLKLIRQFSTPTIDGVGISKAAQTSKRFRSMATCSCCGYKWLPTYHNDIRIPGYTGELRDITKFSIKDIEWQKAHWHCPHCGRDPKLTMKSIEWVCENPGDNFEANTFYLTPASCNEVLLPDYLVRTSTEFTLRSEWMNQVLGEAAEESNEQLIAADLDAAATDASLDSTEVHYMGIDAGLLCAIVIGRMTQAGELLIVHKEMCPVNNLVARRNELISKYRIVVTVMDSMPYTPLVADMCAYDPNMYACLFVTSKSPELFTVKEKEEKPEDGTMNLRLVKVSRDRGLDEVMVLYKERKVVVHKGAEFERFKAHALSMKRTKVFRNDELVYTWQKTDEGNDHMHFASLYLLIACRLRGGVRPTFDTGFSLVSRFKLKR